jgi:hypothetical protein
MAFPAHAGSRRTGIRTHRRTDLLRLALERAGELVVPMAADEQLTNPLDTSLIKACYDLSVRKP